MTLVADPRTDPRLTAVLEGFGIGGHPLAPPIGLDAGIDELREFAANAEIGFEAMYRALFSDLDPVVGVEHQTTRIDRPDGSHLDLYLHRPSRLVDTRLPCIVHVHGGGMVILEASGPCYRRWRDELAAAGALVVGVEFRNAAGQLGVHPFPAGLADVALAVRWIDEHRVELGISSIVLSGESGGANLALATALKANREGWIRAVDGVYAQCPYISGRWAEPPSTLPSLSENDGYFIGLDLVSLFARIYDPAGEHATDPLCWPYHATTRDVTGLPPHVISCAELDPFRDEGVVYYRTLVGAGVPTLGRMLLGVSHTADVTFRKAMPDLYATAVNDIVSFATRLAPG